MRLATNAPADWPPVVVESRGVPLEKAVVLAAVERALAGTSLRLNEVEVPFPFPEGVVIADAVVERGRDRWPLFVYASGGLGEAQHFRSAERMLTEGFPNFMPPVYYAPKPLPQLPAVKLEGEGVERGFVFQAAVKPKPGNYPMWRASMVGERFDLSPAWGAVAEVYRFLRGREWVGLGVVLQAIDAARSWREAEDLKTKLFLMPLQGPGRVAAALSYRGDRGLRLHLHESVSPEWYVHWWRWLLGFLKRHWPEDAPETEPTSPPWEWWLGLHERVRSTPAEMVGVVRL